MQAKDRDAGSNGSHCEATIPCSSCRENRFALDVLLRAIPKQVGVWRRDPTGAPDVERVGSQSLLTLAECRRDTQDPLLVDRYWPALVHHHTISAYKETLQVGHGH